MSDEERSHRAADSDREDQPLKTDGANSDAKSPSRERSVSPARSVSPVREKSKSRSRSPRRSRSRSPVAASPARSPVRERSRSLSKSRSPVRSRSRSRSRDRSRSRSRARASRSRSRDRDVRRRSRSRSRDRFADRDRGRFDDRDRFRRRSPPPRERYGRDMGPPRYRSPVRSRRPAPTTGLHLFAAGLNFIINERDLEKKFEKYGPVREARIVRNPRSGESRGFGFLIMENDDDVDRAIRHLDGRDWNGRRLLVERAKNIK